MTELKKSALDSSEEYTGPQTVQALMKAFDGIYNRNHSKTTVSVFRKASSGHPVYPPYTMASIQKLQLVDHPVYLSKQQVKSTYRVCLIALRKKCTSASLQTRR